MILEVIRRHARQYAARFPDRRCALSPERSCRDPGEIRACPPRLLREGQVDYLDISCWDTFTQPEDPAWGGGMRAR